MLAIRRLSSVATSASVHHRPEPVGHADDGRATGGCCDATHATPKPPSCDTSRKRLGEADGSGGGRSSRGSRVAHQPEDRCGSAIDRAILLLVAVLSARLVTVFGNQQESDRVERIGDRGSKLHSRSHPP